MEIWRCGEVNKAKERVGGEGGSGPTVRCRKW